MSEFTITGLEEKSQLVLAAWAVSVCGRGRYQPPGTPRFLSGCRLRWLGGAPGPQTPAARHKWCSINGIPPAGGIPGGCSQTFRDEEAPAHCP